MNLADVLTERWEELGPRLQRGFWKPLRNMMEIFHLLPLIVALIVFVLLATDGQFREIYIGYLEGPNGQLGGWITSIVVGFVALGLISAVLYEAHYSLSTMRLNIVYSSYSNPETTSLLRTLQRTAAFVLVLFPWLGVTLGLFNTRNFVADRYCQLFNRAKVPQQTLDGMQHLMAPENWMIAAALVFVGVAIAVFSCVDQQNRIAQRAVAYIAPGLAALLFLLFTDWLKLTLPHPSWKFAAPTSWSIATWTYFLVFAATVLYALTYHWLYRRRGGFVYSRPDPDTPTVARKRRLRIPALLTPAFYLYARPGSATGVGLRKRRRRLLVAWALLPWACVAIYFVVAPHFAQAGPPPQPGQWDQCPLATGWPLPGRWTIFPLAMCVSIAMGLLCVQLLDRFSAHRWRRPAIVIMVVVFFVATVAVSGLLSLQTIVWIYQAIGPLGTTGLELVFLISTFALLAGLSQRSGFPALTLSILAFIVCAMFPAYIKYIAYVLGFVWVAVAILALLAGRYAVSIVAVVLLVPLIVNLCRPEPKKLLQISKTAEASIQVKFACWLEQRGIKPANPPPASCTVSNPPPFSRSALAAGQKYPVYIIAAEGGGIYAASAAAMFMAKLQDKAPHFAEHVFAISGVSGGAIGSTIFDALDHDPAAASTATQQKNNRFLQDKVAAIMGDDHFSPVVGAIFPEILGLPTKRPDVLEESFWVSVNTQDGIAADVLSGKFGSHWDPAKAPPALVLNTTWVETGFRAAFAPFDLHDINQSLYSFDDLNMPDESTASLITAAVASARFPVILPPLSAVMIATETTTEGGKEKRQEGPSKRWNFVDGGYADNSGATTALDLYQAMQKVLQQPASQEQKTPQASPVDLRIILITSANPQPNLTGPQINGTSLGDMMAPVDAIMSVRSDLGNDAVARVCSTLYPQDTLGGNNQTAGNRDTNGTCVGHSTDTDRSPPLQIVEIQDVAYGLALGWKISRTTFDVVSWMLGEPNGHPCAINGGPPSKPQPVSGQPRPASTALQGAGQQGAGELPAAQPVTPEPAVQPDATSRLTIEILERNTCILNSIAEAIGDVPATAPGAVPPTPN
jgi:hypothetical protein